MNKLEFQISTIGKNDYAATAQLIRDVIKKSWATRPKKLINSFCRRYTETSVKRWSKSSIIFIAKHNQNVVGTIRLKKNELKTFFINNVYQGAGLGTLLYNILERQARKNKISSIIVESSPEAKPIYEHLGFTYLKAVKRERAGEKFNHYLLTKNLV